jgi:hypothetical protein
MVSAERLLASTCFVTYYYNHLLVSHPAKKNMYIALQNENGISVLTIIVNERTDNATWWEYRKQYPLQAGILKHCAECCKMIL